MQKSNNGFWIQIILSIVCLWLFILSLASCNNPAISRKSSSTSLSTQLPSENPSQNSGPTRYPIQFLGTPTPDSPHPLPPLRTETIDYTVQSGDTLRALAVRYGVGINQLIETNQISDPNQLAVGQNLIIPPPIPISSAPDYKIIPDSELVYGPATITLNLEFVVNFYQGYLSTYAENLDAVQLSGVQIIERVGREQSVNPRLLLAILEYQSGWGTKPNPLEETVEYPMRYSDPSRSGLYRQLSWAANNLNRGYYLWRVNGISHWILSDGNIVLASPYINPGTAGIQYLMSLLYGREEWEKSISPSGIQSIYKQMFGNPFDVAVDPILPIDLAQPALQLPFESETSWSFTGGPHGGWGDGSGWAGLDFAPPGEALGCVQSDAWVVAMAGGIITRSDHGIVIEDLDGDGYEQTGWILIYMHIETRDRVELGKKLNTGDRIGHPSCEGGISTGTHIHTARRYNGEWIPADGPIPFNLDGWISEGSGSIYNGYLRRDDQVVEARVGRSPENSISR